MREQERERGQKLIEGNRMKTKYPEKVRERQRGHRVTWRERHTEQSDWRGGRGGHSSRSICHPVGGAWHRTCT